GTRAMPESSDISAERSAPPSREAAPAGATSVSRAAAPALPQDALIIMPVRNTVLFPGMVLPIAARRERSVAAAQAAVRDQRPLGLLLQRDAEAAEPGAGDLYTVGTAARVLRYLTAPDGTHNAICQGEERFRIVEFLDGHPFLAARVERIAEPSAAGAAIDARVHQLKQRAIEALQLVPNAPPELVASVQGIEAPGTLADIVAGVMDLKPDEKQQILETIDLQQRLDKVIWMLDY